MIITSLFHNLCLPILTGEFLYAGNSSANINDDTYHDEQSDLIYRTSVIDKGDDTFDFSQQLNVYVNLEPNSWFSLDYLRH